jgi:hypothetical protein
MYFKILDCKCNHFIVVISARDGKKQTAKKIKKKRINGTGNRETGHITFWFGFTFGADGSASHRRKGNEDAVVEIRPSSCNKT